MTQSASHLRAAPHMGRLWPIGRTVPHCGRSAVALGIRSRRSIWRRPMPWPQNHAIPARHHSADDACASHSATLAVDPYENKGFLPTFNLREHGIALSWGCPGRDIRQTRSDRGRQRLWYKDLWHSHSPRLWRWWLYQEARTGSSSKRPSSCRFPWNARQSSDQCSGRTLGFVRSAPLLRGGA